MTTWKLHVAAALAAGLATFPLAASAHDYLPLDTGNHWSYQQDDGDMATSDVTGRAMIRGRDTAVRYQVEPSDGGTYENYWTRGPDGTLYLHGARNFDAGVAWAYEPPIPYVAQPLGLGTQWSAVFDVFNIDSGNHEFGPNAIGFEVYTEGPIPLPVGSLYAWGIGQYLPATLSVVTAPGHGAPASSATYSLLGRRLDATGPTGSGGEPVDWFTNGVGLVQYGSAGNANLYRLTSFATVVPVAATTWSGIKTLLQ